MKVFDPQKFQIPGTSATLEIENILRRWKIITTLRNFKNLNKINFLQTGTSRRKMSLQCQWEVIVKTTEIHVMTVKGCEPRSKIAGKNLPKKCISLVL